MSRQSESAAVTSSSAAAMPVASSRIGDWPDIEREFTVSCRLLARRGGGKDGGKVAQVAL